MSRYVARVVWQSGHETFLARGSAKGAMDLGTRHQSPKAAMVALYKYRDSHRFEKFKALDVIDTRDGTIAAEVL